MISWGTDKVKQGLKLVFIAPLHWRGSSHGFPLGGKLSQKTPKVDFVTDEGNWFVFVAFPLIRLAFARHLPPRGEGKGCVAKLNNKLKFEQQQRIGRARIASGGIPGKKKPPQVFPGRCY